MSKTAKKAAPASKEVKKVEEKPKFNYEELILKNLAEPRISLDRTGYHFTFLDLNTKGLDALQNSFSNYKAIQRIDLHGNNITDFSALATLPNLLWLDISQNNVKDLKALQIEEGFKNLKYLNASKNRINELITPKCLALTHLILTENLIEKMEAFEGHENLKILELRGNRLATTQQLINMPKLQELYLSANKIKTIAGIDSLVSLTKLHLRQNNIEVFEENFPNLENLQYLNLRDNKMDKIEELEKLKPLANLKTLIVSFNPLIGKNPTYLYQILNMLLKLKRINSTEISKGIQLNAYKFAEEAFRVAEEERKRKEEEERIKAEQEQPQDS